MYRRILILILFLPLASFSQKEAANWYFGYQAGLDFNSGVAVSVTDGQLNQSEGCATISDSMGNLLFYTNGISVYNASHLLMQNGTGLMGDDSASQSAIIVLNPGDDSLYYIFTVDAAGGPANPASGFRYSVVDMSLDGGLGGVVATQKNILLESSQTEQLTSVAHQNEHDIWVMSHRAGNNDYFAYLITDTGVQSTPVLSQVGTSYVGGNGTCASLKFSPDGKYVAAAKYEAGLELCDFDNASGIVSNSRLIYDLPCMGVEFSPNSKILYHNQEYLGLIHQYDISSGDEATIQASGITLGGIGGALQLAIDGKIYIARPNTGSLAVIHNPNSLGLSCNFQAPAQHLLGKISGFGLPAFVQSIFTQEIEEEGLCAGNPTLFNIRSGLAAVEANWDFGDGTNSLELEPEHVYPVSGTYTVGVDFSITAGGDTIHIEEEIEIIASPVANDPGDMHSCDTLPNDDLSAFTLQDQDAAILGTQTGAEFLVEYFLNEDDAIANVSEITASPYSNTTNPQVIYSRISNSLTGCYDIIAFNLVVDPVPVIGELDPLKACETTLGLGKGNFDLNQANAQIVDGNANLQVTYFASQSDQQNNIPIANPSNFTGSGQNIFFSVVDPTVGCPSTGTLLLIVHPLPVLDQNIPTYNLCDYTNSGDGREIFDLTSMQTALSNQSGMAFTYSYDNVGTPVTILTPNAFENTAVNQQTISVTAENEFGCTSTTSFTIKVNALPEINDNLPPFVSCEVSQNHGSFDLSAITQALANDSGLTINYYATLSQAETGANNALPSPFLSPNATIFARALNAEGCFTTEPIELQVVPSPTAIALTPLQVCDDNNDGFGCFDLTLAAQQATGGDPNLVVTFHETATDAQMNATAINGNNYCNINPATQTLYIRISYNAAVDTGCANFTQLQLIVNPVPVAAEDVEMQACDTNGDAAESFDLTQAITDILDGMDAALYDVTFYANEPWAIAGSINNITNVSGYVSQSNTIWVRVENIAAGCFDVVPLQLTVNPIPNVPQPVASYSLCDNVSDG
ncbi:MAG TPA: PKD domain-containing protein, partial [Flavobacterium sp.]